MTDNTNVLPRGATAADHSMIWPPGDELSLLFRAASEALRHCTTGWAQPEATETWSLGRRSVLVLPAPRAPLPHLLTLQLRPHVVEGRLATQGVRVLANGVEVGVFTLARRGERACVIPAAVLTLRPSLEIVFETSDAARPSDLGGGDDTRQLAIALIALRLYPDRLAASDHAAFLSDTPVVVDIDAVARADQMALSQLMLHFESLGQNCEFGLVQRKCGAEPLGLLRFASTPLPNLLAAIAARFEGMGLPDSVRVEMSANGREFMVKDSSYGLIYHAWVKAGEMTAEELHRREVRRVPVLVRKLLEDIELGEKIFVFKGMGALAEEAVFPLAAALRRHGPNRLLFVTLADAAHPGGTVEPRAAGYLVGHLDRFAPGEDAHDFVLDQWVNVCRGAYRLAHAVWRRAA
jgi:hypothetical protein